MLCAGGVECNDIYHPDIINEFIKILFHAVCSTYHSILWFTPDVAIFQNDMLFDIPYIDRWNLAGEHVHKQVLCNTKHEISTFQVSDYCIGGHTGDS